MTLNKNSQTINRLSSILDQILLDAVNIDKKNALNKSHKLIENNNLFSAALFSTQSDRFVPYTEEVQQKIIAFSQLTQGSNQKNKQLLLQFSTTLLQKIEQQIMALLNALQANKAMHQAAQANQTAKKNYRYKAAQQNRLTQLAKKVMLSSHQLYEKLTEHHDFERRLSAMIFEKEQQLAQCNTSNKNKLSSEALALHHRLGRCRRAISDIEREIEHAEKIK